MGEKEHLGDEATMKLVQLLLGQYQPVSLSKASCTREGHFAHVDSVVLLLFLGLGVGKRKKSPELCATDRAPEHRDQGSPCEIGFKDPRLW